MTQAETAEHFNISTRWIRTLQRRYHNGGIEALEPRSKRPHTNPRALAPTVVDRILKLRQELIEQGTNAGAHTIAWHLQRDGINPAPAPSTIHRVLANNGHITPQPQKRPRSSWRRFQADQPNETWQMDYSDWTITGHRKVAILTILDDHSRFIISCHAYTHATVENVLESFIHAGKRHGRNQAVDAPRLNSSLSISRGVAPPRICRGVSLSSFCTHATCSGVTVAKSVPFL